MMMPAEITEAREAFKELRLTDADMLQLIPKLLDEVDRLRGRVQDLLEANNRYLERARHAEFQLDDAA